MYLPVSNARNRKQVSVECVLIKIYRLRSFDFLLHYTYSCHLELLSLLTLVPFSPPTLDRTLSRPNITFMECDNVIILPPSKNI